ncbi:uncharacterized protein LOC144142289 isoform X3 [Haemaphysalis longicornis]
MAGNMEGGARSFVVTIDLGDFELDCRVYFSDPDKTIRCTQCNCIPDVTYSRNSNYGFCRTCFFSPSAYTSSEGTIQTCQIPPFVSYNTALLDAVIQCPGCGQRCKYEGLKTHFKLSHPELFKRDRQHRPSEVQQGNGVGPVLGSQSQQQAVQNEQYKNTSPLFKTCKKWFKEQMLRYYDENIKQFSPSEVEGIINSQEHLDGCPTISSMFNEWYVTAWSKYQEHKKNPCSGCRKRCESFEELAENCRNFLAELEALATEGMFEYYQQHANGCPGSDTGTKGTENENGKISFPNTSGAGNLMQLNATLSIATAEPVKTSLQYRVAKVGEGTEPPVENAECPNCLEEWSCEEIREHEKSCTTHCPRCTKCKTKVIIDFYKQHCDECSGVTQGNNVQEADKDCEEWNREIEVAALRKRVKELEERLQKLELSIKELLQKLRHED